MAEAQINHKFIPTSRGGRYLCVGGFMYRLNKRKRDWISWRYLDKNCGSTASTIDDIVTKVSNDHNHEPVHNEIQMKEALLALKKTAKSTLQPMPSLYDEETNKLRGDYVSTIPTFESYRTTLYRERRSTLPKLPTSRQDLDIPAAFQTTETGEQFLLRDDGRFVIYATDSNLEKLCAADTIYGDGTFYSSPKMFYQLYTLHAMIDGQMFPLVFAFLPDKREDTYRQMFQTLVDTARTKGFQLAPQCIQVDNLWVDILENRPDDPRCTSLADYVTTQWIEGDLHTRQWNHFGNDGPRTNNHLEGYHNRLNKLVKKAHPNIFEAIQFIKSVQMTTEPRTRQYAAGGKPPSKKRKYVRLDETLRTLKTRLQNGAITTMAYADAASFHLKLS